MIIHLNIVNFAAAIEQGADPLYKGRPLIVAATSSPGSIVYDMNENAYGNGVRKGMKMARVTRICRGGHVLLPRPELYARVMRKLIRTVGCFSPSVEVGSGAGHFFIDMSGTRRLLGTPADVAWRIRKEIHKQFGLYPVWTLARGRLVAKIASRTVKPAGECVVAPGSEKSFLHPLSIDLLPGVNSRDRRLMQDFNLTTIGSLASLDRKQLAVVFGRRSSWLYAACRGEDSTPPGNRCQTEFIQVNSNFAKETSDPQIIHPVLRDLVSRIGGQLRSQRQFCRRIVITLWYSDGRQSVRQATTRQPTANDRQMNKLAMLALQRAWKRRIRLRSCQLVCDQLQHESPQLSLFQVKTDQDLRYDRLLQAIDQIRDRFGHDAVRMI